MTIAEKAAQIWADKIKSPVQDAGDDAINLMLPFNQVHTPAATTFEIECFKDKLIQHIETSITGKHKKCTLNVDYGPDIEFDDICQAAGINRSLLPVKSTMWIYPDKIQYKFGYGQPIRTITLGEIQNS